jgi:hypothetical protein
MSRPPHPPRLYNSNYTWQRAQIMKLLVMQLSPPSRHSIPLWSKHSTDTLFSNTLSLYSSLTVRDHVSHPHRTTGKIIVLYILTFTFFGSRREEKVLHRMVACITRIQSPLDFFLNKILICYCLSQILELWHIFKWSVSYFYFPILACILVPRQNKKN